MTPLQLLVLLGLFGLALGLYNAPRLLDQRHTHARCPDCGYLGCDGSLSQCPGWR